MMKFFNKDVKERLIKAIPPTIVSLVLFFTLLKWFGIHNAILSLTMTMTFVKFMGEDKKERQWIVVLGINLILPFFAYIATMNMLTLVIVDLIIPFLLVYLLMDSDSSKAYYSYGLTFLLLQSFTIPLKDLPLRIGAVFYAYGIIFLGVLIFEIHKKSIGKNNEKKKVRKFFRNAFYKVERYLENIRDRFVQMFRILRGMINARNLNVKEGDGFYYLKMRFAIRLACLVAISFWLEKTFNISKGYWLPMNVFIMILPYHEDTIQKIKGRIWGNMLGIMICFILFYFVKDFTGHMIILSIVTFLRYFVKRYVFLATYMTCYALTLGSLYMKPDELFGLRIVFVLLAGVLAFIGSQFIFKNKKDPRTLGSAK